MKDLITALAVALAVALIVFAAAVYRTWTEAHLTMVVVAGSLICLAVPVASAVATFLVVRARLDSAAEVEREKRMLALLEEQKRLSVITLQEQRQQTEVLRAGRLLPQAPPAQIVAPDNPWQYGAWDEDED